MFDIRIEDEIDMRGGKRVTVLVVTGEGNGDSWRSGNGGGLGYKLNGRIVEEGVARREEGLGLSRIGGGENSDIEDVKGDGRGRSHPPREGIETPRRRTRIVVRVRFMRSRVL